MPPSSHPFRRLLSCRATPRARVLSFSFQRFLVRSPPPLVDAFVRLFSSLSPTNHSSPRRPSPSRRPLIYRTCVRLRTRRYYLLLRSLLLTLVLLRPPGVSTTFRTDLRVLRERLLRARISSRGNFRPGDADLPRAISRSFPRESTSRSAPNSRDGEFVTRISRYIY